MNNALDYGRQFLSLLKLAAGTEQVFCLPVGTPIQCILRPLATHTDRLNPNDIKCLTDWRNRFVQSFLTEFEATNKQTEQWLTEIVYPNNSKILFMLDNINRNTFGYMGLDFIDWETGYGEADAIVKGSDVPRGTMKIALQTLIHWSFAQLGLTSLGVRVRSDNTALDFYRKVGFIEKNRVPLNCFREVNMIRWIEDSSLDYSNVNLVHMLYNNPK